MKLISTLCLSFVLSLPLVGDEGFVALFNGKDLSGWQSVREGNKEGSGSFSVDEEGRTIHVYAEAKDGAEQPVDCLYTVKEYSDYILKMEYKWLDRRFPPRETSDRDAGLLFHIHGNLTKLWPSCLEMQLGESDAKKTEGRYLTGDLWVIGKDVQVMNGRGSDHFYKAEAPLVLVGKGQAYDSSFTTVNAEKPHGEWNEVTLTVRAGKEAIFDLNGVVVNRITEMTTLVDGKRVPLEKGRIGLQAEYAELLYRNIRIKELAGKDVKVSE
ncbi:MAG: 3-keto-disaccharide hydrolase [Akkermansiaceae bacterium]